MRREQCGFGLSVDSLTPNDYAEVKRFTQMLHVEKARRDGADPGACDMLEAAIYPEGIGRETAEGEA